MFPFKMDELDNDEMADLILHGLEYLEMEFDYDFGAAVSVEDGDESDQCKVTIYMNRQERGYGEKR